MTDAAWNITAELLASADRMGTFYLGVAIGMAMREGGEPDRQLLYAASKASSVVAIDVIFDRWKKTREAAHG